MPGETNNDLFIKEKENNNMQNKWIKNHNSGRCQHDEVAGKL